VFAERGFNGASVSDIAAAAGCSTGALYVHFKSKEKLFTALIEEGVAAWRSGYQSAVREAPDPDSRATAVIEHWAQLLEHAPQSFLLFMEFWAAAARDPALQDDFAHGYAQIRETMAQLIHPPGTPAASGLTDSEFAAAFVALADGFALQRMADPTAIPDELMLKIVRRLFS
jgi:AcrR family transcriptional regulator